MVTFILPTVIPNDLKSLPKRVCVCVCYPGIDQISLELIEILVPLCTIVPDPKLLFYILSNVHLMFMISKLDC